MAPTLTELIVSLPIEVFLLLLLLILLLIMVIVNVFCIPFLQKFQQLVLVKAFRTQFSLATTKLRLALL